MHQEKNTVYRKHPSLELIVSGTEKIIIMMIMIIMIIIIKSHFIVPYSPFSKEARIYIIKMSGKT